jgi:hypothetical protein
MNPENWWEWWRSARVQPIIIITPPYHFYLHHHNPPLPYSLPLSTYLPPKFRACWVLYVLNPLHYTILGEKPQEDTPGWNYQSYVGIRYPEYTRRQSCTRERETLGPRQLGDRSTLEEWGLRLGLRLHSKLPVGMEPRWYRTVVLALWYMI